MGSCLSKKKSHQQSPSQPLEPQPPPKGQPNQQSPLLALPSLPPESPPQPREPYPIQKYYCARLNHNKQDIIQICLNEQCTEFSGICWHCLADKLHLDHQNDLILLDACCQQIECQSQIIEEYLEDVLLHLNKAETILNWFFQRTQHHILDALNTFCIYKIRTMLQSPSFLQDILQEGQQIKKVMNKNADDKQIKSFIEINQLQVQQQLQRFQKILTGLWPTSVELANKTINVNPRTSLDNFQPNKFRAITEMECPKDQGKTVQMICLDPSCQSQIFICQSCLPEHQQRRCKNYLHISQFPEAITSITADFENQRLQLIHSFDQIYKLTKQWFLSLNNEINQMKQEYLIQSLSLEGQGCDMAFLKFKTAILKMFIINNCKLEIDKSKFSKLKLQFANFLAYDFNKFEYISLKQLSLRKINLSSQKSSPQQQVKILVPQTFRQLFTAYPNIEKICIGLNNHSYPLFVQNLSQQTQLFTNLFSLNLNLKQKSHSLKTFSLSNSGYLCQLNLRNLPLLQNLSIQLDLSIEIKYVSFHFHFSALNHLERLFFLPKNLRKLKLNLKYQILVFVNKVIALNFLLSRALIIQANQ